MQVLTRGVTDLGVSQAVTDNGAPGGLAQGPGLAAGWAGERAPGPAAAPGVAGVPEPARPSGVGSPAALQSQGAVDRPQSPGPDRGAALLPEPVSRAPGGASLGDPQQRRLGQGAAVVSLDLPQAPVTCLDFWCRAGSAAESAAESGLAHFLEHMVFKGSERLAAGQFDLRVEALGGSSNAATGFDDVHYHVLVPPRAAAEAIDLLLDLVLAPRLDPQDFDLERQVVLEELAQSEDQPEEVAFQHLLSRACPGHAYGEPILGRREALEGHSSAAMAAFHRRLYRADNCCLAVAGPLGDGALLEHLERSALAGLAASAQPEGPGTGAGAGIRGGAAPLRLQPGSDTVALPRLEAARLLMAWQVPAAADQEAVIGCDLLTTLLAEGRRSRLVARLREQLRLVESIDLDLNGLEAGSLVLLEAVCDSEHLPAVEAEIRRVLLELIETPPPQAELARAQRLVGNGYRFGLEAAGSVAGLLGNNHLWGRHQALQAPLEAIGHWDPQRLGRELAPLLDPDRAFCLRALPA